MGRIHAAIRLSGEEEYRGIGSALFHAMEWRVSVEGFELIEVFHGAKLGDVECAVGIEFDAEHVKNADMSDHGACEVRVLRKEGAHEEAPIASTFHRKFLRTGVASFNQVGCACGKIIEHVLLVGEITGEMPLFTVLPSAAKVCDDVDPAVIEPDSVLEVETGTHAVSVTAVSVEECGIVSIEGRAFLLENVDGYAGAISADSELSNGLNVAEIDWRRVAKCCRLGGS